MLGIAYNMIAASASWMKWSDGLGTLMNIIASFIALMIAGLAPMMLMKFAPVIPAGAGGQNGPSLTPPTEGIRAAEHAGRERHEPRRPCQW